MQKTILITGATDGIGLATARALSAMGHHLLLHGRNADKLASVAQSIAATPDAGRVETYVADLSSMREVEALAAAIGNDHPRIDVLINNAGVFHAPDTRTDEGFDVRFAVNTFAPYLLTQRLLPLLGHDGRVVNVSSAAQAPVNPDALAGSTPIAEDFSAYAQSKLALTMWSHLEGQKHRAGGPLVVAVNPGSMLGSKMVREGFGVDGGDIEIGADILCRAALDADFAGASGSYWDNDSERFADPHADALDTARCEAVTEAISAAISTVDSRP